MTLCNNSFSLASAIGSDSHCEPASRIVRDGSHFGTMFSWVQEKWVVVDLENRNFIGTFDRLAVVSLASDEERDEELDADSGLNQAALGCDLDCPQGEWVVDADDLSDLRETYGDALVVLWEQEQR